MPTPRSRSRSQHESSRVCTLARRRHLSRERTLHCRIDFATNASMHHARTQRVSLHNNVDVRKGLSLAAAASGRGSLSRDGCVAAVEGRGSRQRSEETEIAPELLAPPPGCT